MPDVMQKLTDKEFALPSGSVTWAYKTGPNSWRCAYSPERCRTYLSEYLYCSMGNMDFWKKHQNVYIQGELKPLNEDSTNLFFTGNQNKEVVLNNLKKLNKLEEKNGITPTRVIFIEIGEVGVIFIGDPDWKSTLWKSTLFSFYCKSCLYDKFVESPYSMDYYPTLKKAEKILLSKIKTEFHEEFQDTDWEDIHELSGFYTIIERKLNKPMTKLLLGDKLIDNTYKEKDDECPW